MRLRVVLPDCRGPVRVSTGYRVARLEEPGLEEPLDHERQDSRVGRLKVELSI